MAVACSTKKANPEKENHPANSDYNANKSAYHKICKKRVIDHTEPKSVPKSTQWAFFIAWTPFIPNFMKPFYHFFATSRNAETGCLEPSMTEV